MNLWDVARVCHEANRAYCKALGDHSQEEWQAASDSLRESVIAGVKFFKANPGVSDGEIHEAWQKRSSSRVRDPLLLEMESNGRLCKVPGAKEQPDMRPFAELPFEERLKYCLFRVICGVLVRDDCSPGADDE